MSLKKISIPLSTDEMKYFFEHKEEYFLVDLNNSKLKGNVLLTYLSNLGLKAEFNIVDLDKESKFDLLTQYMTSRHIVESKTFTLMVLQVLLKCKGLNPHEYVEPLLSEDEIIEFINSNAQLVHHWELFLDSCMTFMIDTFSELSDELNLKGTLELVDDQRFIGLNVVNMFALEGFTELYFSLPIKEIKYFERQFNDYMFNGKKLYHYVMNKNNTLLHLMSALVNQQITVNDLESANLL